MYSARLSLGCGVCPLRPCRRRRVSFEIQSRTREAARVFEGNLPSKEQEGQTVQNSDSAGSEWIGSPGWPQAGQRCRETGGATGLPPVSGERSSAMAPAPYTFFDWGRPVQVLRLPVPGSTNWHLALLPEHPAEDARRWDVRERPVLDAVGASFEPEGSTVLELDLLALREVDVDEPVL
jgi:hypothetical protein